MSSRDPVADRQTLGQRVIRELGRRGHRGRYFSFRQYRALREIDSVMDLRHLLHAAGWSVQVSDDVVDLCDQLQKVVEARARKDVVGMGVSELFVQLLLAIFRM